MGSKISCESSTETLITEEFLPFGYEERKMVQNNRIHPYSAIGKLKFIFYNPSTKQQKWNWGTGFLITPEYVLTVAHSCKIRGSQKFIQPTKIQFYPEPLYIEKPLDGAIQATIFHLDKKYYQLDQMKRRPYDCIILKLFSQVENTIALKCKFDYSLQQHRSSVITIPGYPDKESIEGIQFNSGTKLTNALFYDEKIPKRQDAPGLLKYLHSTSEGTSGAPLILKKTDNTYEVIGLHIGRHGNQNVGLLFKACVLKDKIEQITNVIRLTKQKERKVQAFSWSRTMKFNWFTQQQIESVSSIDTIQGRQVYEQLKCLLTHSLIRDPVFLPCGHSFSRKPLIQWVGHRSRCPLCYSPANVTKLFQNLALQRSIERFRKKIAKRGRQWAQQRIMLDFGEQIN